MNPYRMNPYYQYAGECFRKILTDTPTRHVDYGVTLELVQKLQEKYPELSIDDAHWFAEEAILDIHYRSLDTN